MGPIDALWHLLNFIVPALGVGFLTALLARLLWFRALKGVSVLRLGLWGSAAALLALAGGLVVFGRDGKMATYGAMVLACALALWWAGFGPSRR